jgi:hypothetical protein
MVNHQVRWKKALQQIAENDVEPNSQKIARDALVNGKTGHSCPDCGKGRPGYLDLLVCEECRDDRDHVVRQRRIRARTLKEENKLSARSQKFSASANNTSRRCLRTRDGDPWWRSFWWRKMTMRHARLRASLRWMLLNFARSWPEAHQFANVQSSNGSPSRCFSAQTGKAPELLSNVHEHRALEPVVGRFGEFRIGFRPSSVFA